jgi:S1-C subfamily serine protease
MKPIFNSQWILAISFVGAGPLIWSHPGSSAAQDVQKQVLDAQAKRIAVIEKIKPSVVAIFGPGGQGGGSGVLITKDGYALSNFHVVQAAGTVMHCGLPDGVLYDAVLVGLDKVGDVALIKLLPKKEGRVFPCATLGDSDKVRAGDWSLALGNPFLLATDFTPTVTFGLVSGVHRYQYPEPSRGLLEYTDCIQVDASINPGNSGGPLFNMDGELVGINGRISIEKRGRVNSGVGYAISINQIKNFMGHLRAGLDVEHATLGAIIEDREIQSSSGMVVTRLLENSDAHRRGLELGDELVSFAGRPVTNQNQYQNVLGIFPKGWRVPLVYRRDNAKHEILVRLMGILPHETEQGQEVQPQPRTRSLPRRAPVDSPAAKLYEAKPGYANFYFNRQERDRLWTSFRKHGDFTTLSGRWTIEAELENNQGKTPVTIVIADETDAAAKRELTTARFKLGEAEFKLEPLKAEQAQADLKEPPNSGGLLMALYQYRRLLTAGEKGFEDRFSHGGREPFYPMKGDGTASSILVEPRANAEVLHTEHAATPTKWYFSLDDHSLLGFEATVIKDEDPCEVYLSEYRKADGRDLPYRIEVRYANASFGVVHVKKYELSPPGK